MQQHTIPKHTKSNPTGKKINSHKHAFSNAPVSLNAMPSKSVSIAKQIKNVIISSYPSRIKIIAIISVKTSIPLPTMYEILIYLRYLLYGRICPAARYSRYHSSLESNTFCAAIISVNRFSLAVPVITCIPAGCRKIHAVAIVVVLT